MTRGSVFIIDPGRLFRDGLKQLLRKSGFVAGGEGKNLAEVIASVDPAAPPDLVIATLPTGSDLEVGLTQICQIRADFPAAKVVALADTLAAPQFLRALRAGVHAILTKDISSTMLQTALDLVMQDQHLFSAPLTHFLLADATDARRNSDVRDGDLCEDGSPADDPRDERVHAADWHAGQAVTRPPFKVPRSVASAKILPLRAPARPEIALSDRESQILHCLVNGASNKAIARELTIAETTVKVHVKGLLRKLRAANRTQAAIWAMNNQALIPEAPAADAERRNVMAIAPRHTAGPPCTVAAGSEP
jgi:two-component system, NarL family, nitrate/nitrite response regulator NarL